ncbi:hypothetical protein QFC20_005579 [Naganishia adeliensis]|uniref:Uncharacterized protein n=1 Tax=Naganishia adeliensis TaxID=92952 RepID=A0ACC2VLU0_9TREE|nr:hypothetical protein QFC20_005579 [Naganishia adeliensis]
MSSYLDLLGPFQAPLSFLLIIAGPPIFRALTSGVKRFLNPKLNAQPKAYAYNPASVEPRRIPHAVFWIVGIHTAIFAYVYYYMEPFNLFTKYFLPVTANGRILHSAIHSEETGRASPVYPNPVYQHSSQPGHIPTTYLDILAKKLTNSLDNRLLYPRFGHSTFTAAWPRTIPEYMLLKLPEVATWYLLELGICVLVICNVDWTRKGGYKQSFAWIIILAGLAEIWGRLFWPLVVVEGEAIPVSLWELPLTLDPITNTTEAIQLDTIIFQIRVIFLGLLPILLLLLPDCVPEDAQTQLSEIAGTIHQTNELANQALASLLFAAPSTRFLRTMDEMILANPQLQKLRIDDAEREKALGAAVMADQEFKTATDNAYGWVDDDEELTADGNVRKKKGKTLVTNGMREHTRRQLGAQWYNFERISEAYELQRGAKRSPTEGPATGKVSPAESTRKVEGTVKDQTLRNRTKAGRA